MRKTVEIYALTVCFFTMACLAIATGNLLWNGVKLAAPALTVNAHEYQRHQTDDNFSQSLESRNRARIEKGGYQLPSGADLTAQREQSRQAMLETERRGAMRGLLYMLVIILVDVVVYWFHWRIVRREREAGVA